MALNTLAAIGVAIVLKQIVAFAGRWLRRREEMGEIGRIHEAAFVPI